MIKIILCIIGLLVVAGVVVLLVNDGTAEAFWDFVKHVCDIVGIG